VLCKWRCSRPGGGACTRRHAPMRATRHTQRADPADACGTFTFEDFDTPWIALISRHQLHHSDNCTFDRKVRQLEIARVSRSLGRRALGCVPGCAAVFSFSGV
jgi:hypothetical protein